MNTYQKFFYKSFWVFTWLCLASLLVALVSGILLPYGVTSARVFGGWGYLGLYASLAAAILCLVLLTQSRPLHDNYLPAALLSIAGTTLVVLSGLYVVGLYGAAMLGFDTFRPIQAFLSIVVKVCLCFGLGLMHAAFIISHRPLRTPHIVSLVCGMICSVLAGLSFINAHLYGPSSFAPLALISGVTALVAALQIVKRQQLRNEQSHRKA